MVLPALPFLGCPVVGELTQLDADVVVLGIPHAVSYGNVAWRRLLRQFGKRASSTPTI